jgi:4-alpha-glucanotransferase
MIPVLGRRRAGVLLHPTSLPGDGAVGRLGAEAYRFVDFLEAAGFSVWQTLPLGPADEHGSPYCSQSTHAGNAMLIDPHDFERYPELPPGIDGAAAHDAPLETYRAFRAAATRRQLGQLARFALTHRSWLLPYGLYMLCREQFGGAPWWQWPEDVRHRSIPLLLRMLARDKDRFRAAVFQQYLFHLQWSGLKRHANERGIFLFGDLPFYVDVNSVEVWWDRALFRVDMDGRPEAVAGVPPDYFNEQGQLWGNPLYDWDALAETGYGWWVERLRAQLERFDLTRLDHFRALESYWEIPASAATARDGRWREGPGEELLTVLKERLGTVPLVAEDLGIITDGVRELRDRFDLPGMLVLQFGFDGLGDNPHLPANHVDNAVVYTGTHDNDTLIGWCRSLDEGARRHVAEVLGVSEDRVAEALIEAAYASPARLAVLPMQDLLSLGAETRMNRPGIAGGNWSWRFDWEQVTPEVTALARERAGRYGRLA